MQHHPGRQRSHIRGQLCEVISTGPASVSASASARSTWPRPPWPDHGAAQVRLSSRFRQLAAHKNVRSVVAAAVARELAGFLWAEMVAED